MNSIIIISKQIFHQMESFIIDTDRLVNKIETENVYDNFSKIGIKIKIRILVIILLSQNMTINQTHSFLVKWKIKCVVLLLKNLLD